MVEEETSGNNFILLEETLQNAIEKKKKLSKSSLSQDVIIEQEDGVNLNQEQLDLLERFRRESDTIPYFGSFFPNLDKEAKRRASYDTENEKSNKFEKNKKITNRRKSHAVAIPTHPEADQDKTRSRSLTSSFLSNYFLNHSKKNNSSEFAETEDENSSSILFKIPIVGSRLEARRKSQSILCFSYYYVVNLFLRFRI